MDYTDNNPLTYVLHYNFTIPSRPGKNNSDVDRMSRIPLNIKDCINSCTVEVNAETIFALMKNEAVKREDPCALSL